MKSALLFILGLVLCRLAAFLGVGMVAEFLLTPGGWFALGGWIGFGAGIIGGIWYFF